MTKINYAKIIYMNIFSEKIQTSKQEAIKDFILQNFEAELKPKQYAFWEIKNKDFVATFYNSGKFVIQGKNVSALLDRLSTAFNDFTKDKGQRVKSEKPFDHSTIQPFNGAPDGAPYIGTDESGKGDFFGPLVVAGVLIEEKNRQFFIDLGIKDSKTLKDEQMLEMLHEIQRNCVFSVVSISNQRYNELYIKFRNLNKLLAWGHARVIENILEKKQCDYALSDKFGDESLIKNALMEKGKTIKLEQRVRAESDLAVAAASVLARATFVQRMKDMEGYYGFKFPKGCNDNVISSAKEFIKIYGKKRLIEVCKAHFKTFHELY